MNRLDELKKLVDNDATLFPLIEQIVHIEKRLTEIEQLPFYKVNPANPSQQKMLPAFKIYKELLQQYTNCIKVLAKQGNVDDAEESPLRQWARARINK